MIRLSYRNIVGMIGSAVMTLATVAMLHDPQIDAPRTQAAANPAPEMKRLVTMEAWQLEQPDLIVVVAPRA